MQAGDQQACGAHAATKRSWALSAEGETSVMTLPSTGVPKTPKRFAAAAASGLPPCPRGSSTDRAVVGGTPMAAPVAPSMLASMSSMPSAIIASGVGGSAEVGSAELKKVAD